MSDSRDIALFAVFNGNIVDGASIKAALEQDQQGGDHIVLETNQTGQIFGRIPWRELND